MRVCLICAEFFGWGKRGGFGFATRVVGRELVKRGIEVYAVIPQPGHGQECENHELDGISVIGIDRSKPFAAEAIYRQLDADVYHSQQPSLASWVAQRSLPQKVHLATLRDPRSTGDWWKEFSYPTHSRLQVAKTWFYYENPMARAAMKKMDGLYVPAHYLVDKAQQLYGLKNSPEMLPTPVTIPETIEKDTTPTVTFVGRWDRVKRPELFFELAERFPHVNFIAIGKAHNLEYESELRRKYERIRNLEMVGFVDQFESDKLSRYLSRTWVLVNTSAKEALPNTFVEACAHRCAILSSLDPDNFATRFGRKVSNEDYASGLEQLLENDQWRRHGESGYEYVARTHSLDSATTRHLKVYDQLLKRRAADRGLKR